MPSPGASPVYRDGHRAAIARLRERLRQVEARAAAIPRRDRGALPAGWREDLARLSARVEEPGTPLDVIAEVEAELDAVEDHIEGAILLATGLRAERARTVSARRRRTLRVVGPTLAVAALLLVAFGILRWSVARERAERAADCRAGEWCSSAGQCDAVENPTWPDHFTCGATRDADCAASRGCGESGLCAARDGYCRAPDDGACARSEACRDQGRCVAWRGTCVLDGPHCLLRPACAERGLCSIVDPMLGCQAATHDDCAHSAICRELGACTPSSGQCRAASDGDCRPSAACRERGECTALNGACVPRGAAGCRASVECTYWGLCTEVYADPRPGVPTPRARCVAASDDDCRQSIGCDHDGLCSRRGEGCLAASDADCARSTGCRDGGRCTTEKGKCFP